VKVKLIAGLVVVVALVAFLIVIVRERPPEVVQPPDTLILATTTSTYDSGLLDVLLPPFEKIYNVRVKVVSVGTGAAIRMGEAGDADIVLVHHREGEDKFVAEGYGTARFDMMYNDFIIVGSEDDPAGIKGKKDVVQALKKIATTKAPFVSRGDDSGTHRKELSLWAIAGATPVGEEWYFETGDGMGATLIVANEKEAYVLVDRGTFLAHKGRGDIALVIIVEGDERLFNPYGILPVSPKKHPHVNYELAMNLVRYFQSEKGREIIRTFGVEKFGQPLFIPYP
jgi:tungstate transport system substrate-binding protein